MLVNTRSGWTKPTTAIPYFGSGSSIEWPPATSTPACAAVAAPPRRISCKRVSGSVREGKPTMFSARAGSPPIAQVSLKALAAAMRPNW